MEKIYLFSAIAVILALSVAGFAYAHQEYYPPYSNQGYGYGYSMMGGGNYGYGMMGAGNYYYSEMMDDMHNQLVQYYQNANSSEIPEPGYGPYPGCPMYYGYA